MHVAPQTFYPLSPTFVYFHLLSSIFIHFNPLSSISSTFTNCHPFYPLSSTFIHFHPPGAPWDLPWCLCLTGKVYYKEVHKFEESFNRDKCWDAKRCAQKVSIAWPGGDERHRWLQCLATLATKLNQSLSPTLKLALWWIVLRLVSWSLTDLAQISWPYWIIVRVLLSSRPYQALIFPTKGNKQIQRKNFHLHLIHLVPSDTAENWYMGQACQSTAHMWLEILKTFLSVALSSSCPLPPIFFQTLRSTQMSVFEWPVVVCNKKLEMSFETDNKYPYSDIF